MSYNDNILQDELLLRFFIFSSVVCQFIWFACFRFSLKYIPKNFVVSSCSFIIIIGTLFGICNIWSVLISRTVGFFRFIVVPVALFKIPKNFKTIFSDSWFFRRKLESSAYCDILTYFFYLACVCYLYLYCCLCLLLLLLLVSPKGKGKGNVLVSGLFAVISVVRDTLCLLL